jgi:hypothetical protein
MNEQVDASIVEVSCTHRYYQPGKNFPTIPKVRVARYKKLHFKGPIAACADSAPTLDNPAWTSPAVSPFSVFTAYDVVMHPGSFANLAAV